MKADTLQIGEGTGDAMPAPVHAQALYADSLGEAIDKAKAITNHRPAHAKERVVRIVENAADEYPLWASSVEDVRAGWGEAGADKMADVSRYLQHTRMTEPAGFGPQIERLAPAVSSLSGSVQRLLVHTDCLALYGLDAGAMANVSRSTLPVEERLRRLASVRDLDLAEGRPPAERAVGTCRDFALLLCSFLRTHGVPARVRCGFASYFGEGWWDHWLCEYWSAERAAWLRADPELDDTLRRTCHITFDPVTLPDGAFLTAGEAWLACRAGRLSAEAFGHGEHKGLWFVGMNVARDSLSLNGQEISPWDTWREAPPGSRRLSASQLLRTDALARNPERLPDPPAPPWLSPVPAEER